MNHADRTKKSVRNRDDYERSFFIQTVNSHLKCKAGVCEDFEWGEIVDSLSRSIVESLGHVCKGLV